jgi:hypothetical protein
MVRSLSCQPLPSSLESELFGRRRLHRPVDDSTREARRNPQLVPQMIRILIFLEAGAMPGRWIDPPWKKLMLIYLWREAQLSPHAIVQQLGPSR